MSAWNSSDPIESVGTGTRTRDTKAARKGPTLRNGRSLTLDSVNCAMRRRVSRHRTNNANARVSATAFLVIKSSAHDHAQPPKSVGPAGAKPPFTVTRAAFPATKLSMAISMAGDRPGNGRSIRAASSRPTAGAIHRGLLNIAVGHAPARRHPCFLRPTNLKISFPGGIAAGGASKRFQ